MPSIGGASNWYDVLDLQMDASTAEISESAERLSRQAAAIANTAPERSQHLRDIVRAIRADLLSGPAARQQYDAALARPADRLVPEYRRVVLR